MMMMMMIGILCSKNSNGRLAIPAVAGLLVRRWLEPSVCRLSVTLLHPTQSFELLSTRISTSNNVGAEPKYVNLDTVSIA